MALTWNDNQRKIAGIILRHRNDSESGYELQAIRTELPIEDASDSVISKIAKDLKTINWQIPQQEQKSHGDEKPHGDGTGGGMELSEKGLTLSITLPPVVLTLFDAAKAAGLVDEDKELDSWLFECVQKRFQLDYGLQLMLVPIGKEQEAKQAIKEAAKEAVKEALREVKK